MRHLRLVTDDEDRDGRISYDRAEIMATIAKLSPEQLAALGLALVDGQVVTAGEAS